MQQKNAGRAHRQNQRNHQPESGCEFGSDRQLRKIHGIPFKMRGFRGSGYWGRFRHQAIGNIDLIVTDSYRRVHHDAHLPCTAARFPLRSRSNWEFGNFFLLRRNISL
jgi:hypothetical protein